MDFLQTILATLVTLGVLVSIHEWGHFYVARRCGVRVITFSIGFGKPLFTWYDKQGTQFAIAAIPLGGYVRMLDEREGDVAPEERQYAFNHKSLLQRTAVVAAGPIVNLLFAVLAYWVLFLSGTTVVKPVVGQVIEGSVAYQASALEGGEIVAINGNETLSWQSVTLQLASHIGESGELLVDMKYPDSTLVKSLTFQLDNWNFDPEKESPITAIGFVPWQPSIPATIGVLIPEGAGTRDGLQVNDHVIGVDGVPLNDWMAFVALVKANPTTPLALQVEREGRTLDVLLTPNEKTDNGQRIGYIGAGPAHVEWPESQQRHVSYGFFEALLKGAEKTYQMIALTLDSIWKMLEGVLSVKNLSGPITIAKVAGASAASGIEPFISFLAYLSISLGVLNLLPIPMLDGGHLLYYAIEGLTGKPVSERVQMIGLRIGMALLFSLMALAVINDVMRL